MDEFAEACDLLKKHLPEHDTKEQLMEMCKMMDINKDGLVDLNEFLETFRLCQQEREFDITQAVKQSPVVGQTNGRKLSLVQQLNCISNGCVGQEKTEPVNAIEVNTNDEEGDDDDPKDN